MGPGRRSGPRASPVGAGRAHSRAQAGLEPRSRPAACSGSLFERLYPRCHSHISSFFKFHDLCGCSGISLHTPRTPRNIHTDVSRTEDLSARRPLFLLAPCFFLACTGGRARALWVAERLRGGNAGGVSSLALQRPRRPPTSPNRHRSTWESSRTESLHGRTSTCVQASLPLPRPTESRFGGSSSCLSRPTSRPTPCLTTC